MGILPVSLSANQRLVFKPGDVLVVGTDGLNEARDQNEKMFGYNRLMRLVESLADQSAEGIAQGLYTAVSNFEQGTLQDDDQTLVVLKCTDL
jgi:sigma-B regulation protein RsbU (phosphoserine phosphatase)